MTDTTQSNFTPADMATAAAQGFRDGQAAERAQAGSHPLMALSDITAKAGKMADLARRTERARCATAVRAALHHWRCIPSAHLKEFAELVIAEIEKDKS